MGRRMGTSLIKSSAVIAVAICLGIGLYILTQTHYILTYTTSPGFEFIKTDRSSQFQQRDVLVQLNDLEEIERKITSYPSEEFKSDRTKSDTICGGLTKMVIVQSAFERRVFLFTPNTISLYKHSDNPFSLLAARFSNSEAYFNGTAKRNHEQSPLTIPNF